MTDEDIKIIIGSIGPTPIATCVTDNRHPENLIIAVNESFCALTGYDRTEVIGRNCRFLAGHATESEGRTILRQAVLEGRPTVVELTNYRKDGTPFRNAVMIAPILDEGGQVALYYGSQMDVGPMTGSAGLRGEKAKRLISSLSERQRQVLWLMSTGHRNKQIGFHLGINEKTVKMHRARLFRALHARTTADAIRLAVEAELLATNPD